MSSREHHHPVDGLQLGTFVQPMPLIDIIIVNWNGWRYCCTLLPHLQSFAESGLVGQVIVVDNASTDDSPTLIADNFPWAKLICSPKNLGYGLGNNLGIEQATAPYVWLLNNDTEIVDSQVLERLVAELDRDHRCVAVGPALILNNGGYQTGAAGFDIALHTIFNYFFFLARVFPHRFPGLYLSQRAFAGHAEAVRVDWLCGAAMLVRRAPLVAVGGFPSDYFMYAEDIRVCRSLRQAGYCVKYVPRARLLHHHGGSEGSGTPKTRWLESTLAECSTVMTPARSFLARIIFATGFLMRSCIYGVMSLVRSSPGTRTSSRRMWLFFKATVAYRPAARKFSNVPSAR